MDWEAFYQNFRKPDFVPGYEIQNRLGGGAFGEVYKARKHSIGKAYAVKFLKLDDDTQRDAIERELEQVRHFAAIDHPNLVTIEDMGTVLGVPYLIMGYAGEETLSRRLREGALDPREAMSLFVQIARGVLALHDRRLVHFDLKPGNVFLKGDVARVGDYGLSKLMTSGRLTLSFGRGTPHYMAPEMLRSRADHRADLYSLGVLLYECLAGDVPYEAQTPGGIVLRQEDEGPDFPEHFPAEIRPVVERCLRLDPEERYADVEELLTALGQTARPGESIRLDELSDRRPAVSMAARAALSNGDAASDAQGKRPSSSELRNTAAEFARGAVEVARGVWDGLRTPRGESVTTSTHPGSGITAGHAPPLSGAAPPPAGSAPRTIPVPPRTRGGFLGAITSALALGIEVLFTLVRGAGRTLVGLFRRARDRAERKGGPRPVRALRLVLYVALILIAGAVILAVMASIIEVLGVQ